MAGPIAAAPGSIRLVVATDERVLDSCDVALVKPGTITVELMLRRKPMVVMGRVNPVTAMIARRSLNIERLSMPNLIAGAEIVPELLQGAATRDRIAAALAPLFQGEARERQIEDLDRASLRLGRPGAAMRTARIVEEMLGTAPA
jgi:lipid-A-disaccharide synthase